VTCLECSKPKPTNPRRWARGLCSSCYSRHYYRGTIDQFPITYRPREHVIEDWLFLQAQGYTRPHAAERMGMTRDALDHAIARAKRAGDERLLKTEAA